MDATKPLLIVGAPDAAACEGDFCGVPPQNEQAIVNGAIDSDDV